MLLALETNGPDALQPSRESFFLLKQTEMCKAIVPVLRTVFISTIFWHSVQFCAFVWNHSHIFFWSFWGKNPPPSRSLALSRASSLSLPFTHSHTHTHTHTHTHARTHTRTHVPPPPHMHARTQAYMHARTHARNHAFLPRKLHQNRNCEKTLSKSKKDFIRTEICSQISYSHG